MKKFRHASAGKGMRSAEVALPGFIKANAGGIIDHIVCDDEIEPAIAIVIEKAGGNRPQRIIEPGLDELAEGAVRLVAKQPDPAELGDEHVTPAIVVNVTDGDAHPATRHIEAGARGGVAERSVDLLMKKAVGRRRFRAAILDEVNVQSPVIVVIEQAEP